MIKILANINAMTEATAIPLIPQNCIKYKLRRTLKINSIKVKINKVLFKCLPNKTNCGSKILLVIINA